MTASAPAPLARETATVIPRSLKLPGRVRPLELQEHAGADALGDHRRLDQRGRPLVQGHDRVAAAPAASGRGTARSAAPASDRRSHELFLDHPDRAGRARRKSSVAISSSAAKNRVSGPSCMTITRRASSPRPRWTTLRTETSLRPSTSAIWRARRAGRRPRGGGRTTRRCRARSRAPPAPRAPGALPERIETTSPSTAVAVSVPPAPGPDIVISVIAGASTMTALNGPLDGRQGVAAVEEAREDADADPAVPPLGDPEQLQREARAPSRRRCRRAGSR